jgi:hypothetical protein
MNAIKGYEKIEYKYGTGCYKSVFSSNKLRTLKNQKHEK